jgi:ABC-2 type transport system ATP-binding protein
MPLMIELRDMTKVFNGSTAVENLSLKIDKGEFFGFLGPNGAGKTTTIRILTTLTRPTSGKAVIDGYDIAEKPLPAKRKIGLVPQNYNLDRELSGRQNLELHGRLFAMKRSIRIKKIEQMLDIVGLNEKAELETGKYSGGMKRRLMIARALLHDPEIIFLDEPTVGLDVEGRRKLWGLLKDINQRGKTIFLTTHYIEEAEELCGRVGIIHNGKLIACDTPSNLIATAGSFVVDVFENGDMQSRFFDNRTDAGVYAASITASASIRPANLEDVFVRLTGRKVDQ